MLATAKPSARAAPGANGKHGKAHAVQAEAATLKKVEQRNRTYCVQLQNRCRLFDLEQGALKATYTKKKLTFKKRIEDYERRLSELKDLKLDPSGATFLTEPPAKAAATVEEAAAARRQTASGLMLDLDAVGSIRRQTKPTNGGLMIGRSLLSLQRLQRKHLDEYERAASALRRLEQDVGVSIDANLPRRSYTPPDSVEARAAGAKSSAFLAYQRGQIRAKEKELRQLGLRHSAKKRPKTAPSSNPPTSRDRRAAAGADAAAAVPAAAAGGAANSDEPRKLVHLFCKRAATPKESGAAGESSSTAARDGAVGGGEGEQQAKAAKAAVDRQLNGRNVALLTYNHYAEIIQNPFDDGVLPEVTRSRLLIQAQKVEKMYVWLGFDSHEEMMKALRSKDGKIKQIPAALLHVLEDAAQDDTAEVLDNMVESESEASSDDEDARFKIFDDMKVMGKKAKVKAKHTV